MKRLLVLFVLLFTVFFSYTVLAQEFRSLKKDYEVLIPDKIQNPVLDPLPAGTYSVGTGGYFATIQAAFDKLSTDGIAGEVILELTDNLYTAPAVQFGFVLNGPITGAGPASRVTIKPAQNKNVTIEGNNESLLYLINTSYVTFDGVSLTGSTTLTIHTIQNSTYVFNDALDFINNSDHNIIQNITFIVEDITRASGSGFWFTQTGSAPDSNLIQNNFVKKAGDAFFIVSASASLKGKDNVVRGNQIGSETDSLISLGIEVAKCENSIVEDNVIQNLKVNMTGTERVLTGILSSMSTGTIIRNNVIGNFRAISGYSTSGIFLGSDGVNYGTNNLVYNNMIYDIQSTSSQTNSRVTGIESWYQNNPKIYYNSVYLSGTGTQHLGSAALYIGGANSNVEAKNNILVNTRDESPYCASAIYTTSNLTTDYNDLFYQTNQYNCLVRFGNTNYNTLTDWQAMGKDLHSVNEMPNFVSPDLHINASIATNLEKRAIPIAGIDHDFDDESRDVNLPDIGADEFNGIIPTGALASGTYSVGTTGYFATIQDAFNRLQTDGISGSVTFELIDELYTAPADTFGFLLDGPITGAGPSSRITIKPAANKNVILEGNWRYVVTFRNVSYLTFDGINTEGSTTLTIHSLYNSQYETNRGVGFMLDSDHNVVQNLIVICDDIMRDGIGIFFIAGENTIVAPDSNLIQNNFVKKAGAGIYVSAYYTLSNTRPTGNIIRGNKVGSATDSLIAWGIQVEKCQNSIVENNIVQNLTLNNSYAYENMNLGINSHWSDGDVIRNNIVHDINGNANQNSTGIQLSGDVGHVGNNNLIYNNMVYNIYSTSTQSNSRVAGIQLWRQNNPKVYYNSVNLSGTGTSRLGSGALYIWGDCANVEAKNNIFVNTRDESPYYATAIYDYSASNLTSDYNDLYSANHLVRIGGTNYNTLAEWQATGKDLNSVTELPNFINPDLHIFAGLSYLESHGTPIDGIELDFDGQPRHATNPDIGADEFNGIVVGVEDEIPLPTKFALSQNYPNPFNPSTTFRYSIPQTSKVAIKVYDILGKEIATLIDEEKSVGTYELKWNAQKFSSGIYFYQLVAGEFIQTKKMLLIK